MLEHSQICIHSELKMMNLNVGGMAIDGADLDLNGEIDFELTGDLDDESDESNTKTKIAMIVAATASAATTALLLTDTSFSRIPLLPARCGNEHRDREGSLLQVRSWDDVMFRRQFRMDRTLFNSLLVDLAPALTGVNTKAINSSGSSVCAELKLLITLRVLAGASYLDMIWYNVSVNHVMALVTSVSKVINQSLKNISLPGWKDESGYRALARGWQERLFRKFGPASQGVLPGVVAAGDGLSIAIREPRACDLGGKASSTYINRKGYFALNVQAFCDAHCRFVYFECAWPGSTGDSTAFRESAFYIGMLAGMAPEWVRSVCDEAYSCFGGAYLTPFSKYQLARAKVMDVMLYQRMRAYNHVLSSLRIHIERSFGQLVRRWGILWRCIEVRLEGAVHLIECCARLHNLCVEAWLRDHGGSSDGFEHSIPAPDSIAHMPEAPTDAEIVQRLETGQDTSGERAVNSTARDEAVLSVWNAGIVSFDDANDV